MVSRICIASFAAIFLTATKTWPAPPAMQTPPAAVTDGRTGYTGDAACRDCHRDQFDGYQATAHHRTSRLPDSATIAGQFSGQASIMNTFNPELSFRMEARDGHFYESAVVTKPGHPRTHTQQMDVVIGSATKGQTYLYWLGNRLLELPVSYWTGLHKWVNSPGYVDGSADFERPVTPRCMECHATYIQNVGTGPADNLYNKDSMILGIACERCHGPGADHVKSHSEKAATPAGTVPMPPIGLSRDRQIDICAQCHGGVGQSLAPPFSFRPGEDLAQSLTLSEAASAKQIDVHGNQVLLLKRSRCFTSSASMTCTTCHDSHSPEHPAPSYSAKCLQCHQQQQCGMFSRLGSSIVTDCANCHMPVQESKLLVLDADDTRLKARVRNHRIAVYPCRLVSSI